VLSAAGVAALASMDEAEPFSSMQWITAAVGSVDSPAQSSVAEWLGMPASALAAITAIVAETIMLPPR
jgi:hypothetical protein